MKVIVQYDGRKVIYDNVTKVDCSVAFDNFENKMTIFQGEKKKIIRLYEINSFSFKEEGGVDE